MHSEAAALDHGIIEPLLRLGELWAPHAAGGDLPYALYRIAALHLLLGSTHSHESLDLFARAVHHTRVAADPLLQALRDVSQLAKYDPTRGDIECARRFLAAALLAKFPKQPWPEDLVKPRAEPLAADGPVIIVAGGCDAYHACLERQGRDRGSVRSTLEALLASFGMTLGRDEAGAYRVRFNDRGTRSRR